MEHTKIRRTLPLDLQFFADDTATATNAQTATAPASDAAAVAPAADAAAARSNAPTAYPTDDVAAAILAAVESATSKKEKTVVKSMAEQYGLSDEEAQEALNAAKAKKAAQMPPEVRQQVEALTKAANDRLIAAEVRAFGAEMGLVDAEAALLLLPKDAIRVADDGAVTGAKEALEALQKGKPYLFAAKENAKPTGEKATVGAKIEQSGGAAVTKEQFARMGYKERFALKQKDAALYEALTKKE